MKKKKAKTTINAMFSLCPRSNHFKPLMHNVPKRSDTLLKSLLKSLSNTCCLGPKIVKKQVIFIFFYDFQRRFWLNLDLLIKVFSYFKILKLSNWHYAVQKNSLWWSWFWRILLLAINFMGSSCSKIMTIVRVTFHGPEVYAAFFQWCTSIHKTSVSLALTTTCSPDDWNSKAILAIVVSASATHWKPF